MKNTKEREMVNIRAMAKYLLSKVLILCLVGAILGVLTGAIKVLKTDAGIKSSLNSSIPSMYDGAYYTDVTKATVSFFVDYDGFSLADETNKFTTYAASVLKGLESTDFYEYVRANYVITYVAGEDLEIPESAAGLSVSEIKAALTIESDGPYYFEAKVVTVSEETSINLANTISSRIDTYLTENFNGIYSVTLLGVETSEIAAANETLTLIKAFIKFFVIILLLTVVLGLVIYAFIFVIRDYVVSTFDVPKAFSETSYGIRYEKKDKEDESGWRVRICDSFIFSMLCRVETGKSKNILVTSTEAGNGTTTIGKALQEGLSLAGKNVKLNDLRILGDEVSSDLFAKISKNEKGADDISGNDAVNIFLVNECLPLRSNFEPFFDRKIDTCVIVAESMKSKYSDLASIAENEFYATALLVVNKIK